MKLASKSAILRGGLIIAASIAGSFTLVRSASSASLLPNKINENQRATNAFDLYVKAAKSLVKKEEIAKASRNAPAKTKEQKYFQSLATRQRLLSLNGKTLKLLRQGFTLEYKQPPLLPSFEASSPDYYNDYRSLARLLKLEGQVKTGKQDWNGAMNSYLDAIRFGADIPNNSPLVGMLVGVACQAIGRHEAWEIVSHLDLKQAKLAVKRLNALERKHVSFQDTLIFERDWMDRVLREGGKDSIAFFNESSDDKEGDEPPVHLDPNGPKWISNVVLGYMRLQQSGLMNTLIERARKPYISRTPLNFNALEWVGTTMAPVFEEAWCVERNAVAQNSMLGVTLALHAYYSEHHE